MSRWYCPVFKLHLVIYYRKKAGQHAIVCLSTVTYSSWNARLNNYTPLAHQWLISIYIYIYIYYKDQLLASCVLWRLALFSFNFLSYSTCHGRLWLGWSIWGYLTYSINKNENQISLFDFSKLFVFHDWHTVGCLHCSFLDLISTFKYTVCSA